MGRPMTLVLAGLLIGGCSTSVTSSSSGGGGGSSRLITQEEFAELGAFLDQPFEKYSQGMRARLAFGVSMAAEFDTYLVDEITAVGDAVFRRKCRAVFEEKLQDAQVIMVSHAEITLKEYCDSALVLEDGNARYFDDLEEGLEAYRSLIAA